MVKKQDQVGGVCEKCGGSGELVRRAGRLLCGRCIQFFLRGQVGSSPKDFQPNPKRKPGFE